MNWARPCPSTKRLTLVPWQKYRISRLHTASGMGRRRGTRERTAAVGQTASCNLGLLATAGRECIGRRHSLLVLEDKPVRHPGHASPTKEDDHGDPNAKYVRNAAARALEQGQAHWPEAALAAKTCLVDPYPFAMDGRTRDLAMFNLAIASKLRGCDVVALRVEDVAPSGYAVDRATVRQKPTAQRGTGEPLVTTAP